MGSSRDGTKAGTEAGSRDSSKAGSRDSTEPGTAGPDDREREQVARNRDILNAAIDLGKRAGAIGHAIAEDFGLAPHDLLALLKLDTKMSMKELARLMACDASFVTSVADTLESHGLVRRETSQRDRRVKNLVLTPEGIVVKERMMQELSGRMPWCTGLDDAERGCFLALLRKLVAGTGETARGGDRARDAEPGLAAGTTVRFA